MTFRVTASAIGPHGRLTLPHLVRMFQEAAMRNTVRLGISSPELIDRENASWVLRRQTLHCRRWPGLGEEVEVLTAPSGFARRLLTYRDFHLRDAAGETLATAVTEWLLLDLGSRRVRPLPPDVAGLEAHLAPASALLPRATGKIPPPAATTRVTDSRVNFYQLDFNNHLTNPVFPELMLEPLGGAFLSAHLPSFVDISFVSEARYGEELSAVVAEEEEGYRHALRREQTVLATMFSKWERRREGA